MKFTCTQPALARTLALAGHAIARRSLQPILTTILLEADESIVRVTASNGEGLIITCRLQATIEEPGSIALPARLLTDYIANLSASQVSLSTQGDGSFACVLTGGCSRATLNGMDPAEFPRMPLTAGEQPLMTLDALLLKEAIAQVVFAASEDDSRPMFTAVALVAQDEELTFVGADAFRLAVRRLPMLETVQQTLLVPARMMKLVARLFPAEGNIELRMTTNGHQVLLHSRELDVCISLMEGTYANYAAALPAGWQTRVVVKRQDLAAAVKEILPFARDGGNRLRLTIRGAARQEGDPHTLTLEATAEELGSNSSTITATVTGEELLQPIHLNVTYLAEVLEVLEMPEIALACGAPLRPMVVTPAQGPTQYQYVLMPLSVNRTPAPVQQTQTPAPEPVAVVAATR